MVSIVSILALFIISMVSVEGVPYGSACGSSSDVITLQSFKLLTAHPSKKGQVATFEMSVNLKGDLSQPIQTRVDLEYKVLFFWVASCLPSSNNCIHSNFCTDFYAGRPCDFKAGVENIVMDLAVPSDVPSGEYRVTVRFTTPSGQTGCVFVQGIVIE